MAPRRTKADLQTIDDYIALFAPDVQAILAKIRQTVRRAAPEAQEGISYRMPMFRQGGVLIYFAAFKGHIGIYPPVRGDAGLMKAAARHAGPKGNLQLPLDGPMPLGLIRRIVKHRLREHAAKAAVKRGRK